MTTIDLSSTMELLELDLNAQEIGTLLGVHARTIKRTAQTIKYPLKAGHPSKPQKLRMKDKEAIFELYKQGYRLARIIHTLNLNARAVFRFITEELHANGWARNVCLQCDTEFITDKAKEKKICRACRGKYGPEGWIEENSELTLNKINSNL